MARLFRITGAVPDSAAVEEWLGHWEGELGNIARHWFSRLRASGKDVEEVLHDGLATVCVQKAAFAYVGVFKTHVSVGFFNGATLPDPAALLAGQGRHMRHVKLEPGAAVDAAALGALIAAAYKDVKAQLRCA